MTQASPMMSARMITPFIQIATPRITAIVQL